MGCGCSRVNQVDIDNPDNNNGLKVNFEIEGPVMGSSNSKRPSGKRLDNKVERSNGNLESAATRLEDKVDGDLKTLNGGTKTNDSSNKNNFLQFHTEVSSSQINFFKMLDEKIENGDDFDEEEEEQKRKEELQKCMQEWEEILGSKENSSVKKLPTRSNNGRRKSDNPSNSKSLHPTKKKSGGSSESKLCDTGSNGRHNLKQRSKNDVSNGSGSSSNNGEKRSLSTVGTRHKNRDDESRTARANVSIQRPLR